MASIHYKFVFFFLPTLPTFKCKHLIINNMYDVGNVQLCRQKVWLRMFVPGLGTKNKQSFSKEKDCLLSLKGYKISEKSHYFVGLKPHFSVYCLHSSVLPTLYNLLEINSLFLNVGNVCKYTKI